MGEIISSGHMKGCDLALLDKDTLINEWKIEEFGHRQSLLNNIKMLVNDDNSNDSAYYNYSHRSEFDEQDATDHSTN